MFVCAFFCCWCMECMDGRYKRCLLEMIWYINGLIFISLEMKSKIVYEKCFHRCSNLIALNSFYCVLWAHSLFYMHSLWYIIQNYGVFHAHSTQSLNPQNLSHLYHIHSCYISIHININWPRKMHFPISLVYL